LYTLAQIADCVNGKLVGNGDLAISQLCIDSRKIQSPEQSLFFAIKTDKNNGNLFVEKALNQGVKAVVVSENPTIDCNYILVEDSLIALQKLAAFHRRQFAIPIIGITGSNGKTIVKEWVSYLAGFDFSVCKNPKSYNSQVGVPLSVWGLNEKHTLGVFEAGISKPNEMDNLAGIIAPTIGVFTHLGDAHDANFETTEQKLHEKLLLFKPCDTVVANNYNELVTKSLYTLNKNIFLWGETEDCQLQIVNRNANDFSIIYLGKNYQVTLPFRDTASVENAFNALGTCLALGLEIESLIPRLLHLPTIDMRLQQVNGINGNQLILDYYNADFQSVAMALDFLKQQQPTGETTIVLSEITQSHLADEVLYSQLNNLLQNHKISCLIGIGERISKHASVFKIPAQFYPNTSAFIASYPFYQLKNQTILLKGSRHFSFEKIADKLRTKSHQTVLEVNLTRLQDNLNTVKKLVGPQTKLMAMVKALAYGSGGFQIAKLLEFNNIDYLGVAYTDEAVDLRKAGISLPIMVLNPDLNHLDAYLEQNIQPVIYSFESLEKVKNHPIKIHLEFDTGMHRLGFEMKDLDKLISILGSDTSLEIVSIFSHLAVADDASKDDFTQQQIADFESIYSKIETSLSINVIKHISNTAGMERFSNGVLDMVRLGIGLYGISSKGAASELKPVSAFKSYITQIKEVQAGDGVGYGQHDSATTDRKIAIIAVGYADGYNRLFSQGKGGFVINGKYAKVVGNVCMDMTMCDVTEIECQEGDEALIFGDNPRVEELAKAIGTIPYEILTNVSERVNRVFYQE
jgi:alanine racemase